VTFYFSRRWRSEVTADFKSLLKNAFGLDSTSLGPTAISRAVQKRQLACGLEDERAYLLHVSSNALEMQELIETLVVPETWFFRDNEAFVALTDIVRTQLLDRSIKAPLQILSLPCSSGEEPFSAAMALLDVGVQPSSFRIDAIDISERALALAAHAAYGQNSFRSQQLDFRSRHFRQDGRKWHLSDQVRKQVKFQQGNLFDANFLPGRARYDIIFCRNVLIYFDQQTQLYAIEVLLRLLAPRGYLFVGPSETSLLPRQFFDPVPLPMAFAFRYAPAAQVDKVVPKVAKVATTKSRYEPAATHGRLSAPSQAASAPRLSAVTTRGRGEAGGNNDAGGKSDAGGRAASALARVQQLANEGRLPEAAAAGELYLSEHEASSHGYYLLGLIRDAAGELTSASLLYRKSLYLDPQNQDALRHLVLLLEKQGASASARVLRVRLKRLEGQVPE
jgi:chemotaxis protein methyltransferase WspC